MDSDYDSDIEYIYQTNYSRSGIPTPYIFYKRGQVPHYNFFDGFSNHYLKYNKDEIDEFKTYTRMIDLKEKQQSWYPELMELYPTEFYNIAEVLICSLINTIPLELIFELLVQVSINFVDDYCQNYEKQYYERHTVYKTKLTETLPDTEAYQRKVARYEMYRSWSPFSYYPVEILTKKDKTNELYNDENMDPDEDIYEELYDELYVDHYDEIFRLRITTLTKHRFSRNEKEIINFEYRLNN